MSLQPQSQTEIPHFSDEVPLPIPTRCNELSTFPRTESELATLRLSLAAAAFERSYSLGLDQESATDKSTQLYKTTNGNYARMRIARTALDEATAKDSKTDSVPELDSVPKTIIEGLPATITDIVEYKQSKQRRHTKPKVKPLNIQTLQALELDEDGHIADQAEIEKLIEANMGLVHKWAKYYFGDTMTSEDLVQEGSIGLILAARRFKPARGFAFSTYAERYVKGNILRSIRDKDKIVKGKRDDWSINVTYHKAIEELENNRVEVTDESISEISGLSLDQVRNIREKPFRLQTSSLDAQFNSGDEFGNLLVDYYTGGKIDNHDRVMDRQLVEVLLEKLGDERMETILRARFGITPYDRPYVQREIAEVIGVSQMQISRLLDRAFDSLRIIHENLMKDSE